MRDSHELMTFVAATLLSTATSPAQTTGPSSSDPPYLVPVEPGVAITSVLSAGDSVNLKPDGVTPYRMVGIPDGLGAFDNNDGTFTLFMNHELSSGTGIVRAHGATAAFVSRWTIDAATLTVLHGEDLIQRVLVWDIPTTSHVHLPNASLIRFCSASLAEPTGLYNSATGLGTTERIFFNGEENSSSGRPFAHVTTGPEGGDSFELAHMGNIAFENVLINPRESDTTVAVCTDDSTTGQLYVYFGTKQNTGGAVERAGLVGGALYGVAVTGVATEPAAGIPNGPFTLHNFGDVSGWNGTTLTTQSNANSVTIFTRPEDAHWNPDDPTQLFVATTGSGAVPTRLWRLTFNDLGNPAAGGTIETLIDGNDPNTPISMDNLCTDGHGNLIIQEDRGSSSALARVWSYDLATGGLTVLAQADPARFSVGGASFMTTNEESSGIIDASSLLGPGWFLLTVQSHVSAGDAELVERGQLLALFNPDSARCSEADVTTQGAGAGDPGYGVPDGLVTAADLNYYVNAWVAGDLAIADVTTQGAGIGDPNYGVPDGAVTAADLNFYVNLWVLGCP